MVYSSALFAAPPLRIAVTAGPDGLSTAEVWAVFADAYKSKTGETLEPLIAADNTEALRAVTTKAAEAALIDTLAFLKNRKSLQLIGIAAEFGSARERFLLVAGADSIIYSPKDLWRAKLVLAGFPGTMAWDYPLAWAEPFGPAAGRKAPRSEVGYEGVLRSIALGHADAGFLAEGFFLSCRESALLGRVRVISATPAYPLAVLVVHRDLPTERASLARSLLGLASGSLELQENRPDISEALDELAEALLVDGQ